MKTIKAIANWLESHWAAPAYSGWVLSGLAIFFFGAATNTMAGWLYVISGVSIAILALAAILPARNLQQLQIRRRPIQPVSAGDYLTIEIEIENPTASAKTMLQIQDILPYVLGTTVPEAIEEIAPHSVHLWAYYQKAPRRGIYRWHEVQLRTGAPLGLFWCRRSWEAKAQAVVYPIILPLKSCPLIDEMGREKCPQVYSQQRAQIASEGITRTLRSYRYGDPFRLIHWRSSARYGEFRVRELEIFTGGQEIIIALDSANLWHADDFEQAVSAAASLYFYANRRQRQVKLWTAQTGLVRGNRVVLETLAATNPGEDIRERPSQPLIWLTSSPASLNSLPAGSRWLLWLPATTEAEKVIVSREQPGFEIQPDKPLELQLQSPITRL